MKNIKNPSSDLFSVKAYKAIIQNAFLEDSDGNKLYFSGIKYEKNDLKAISKKK